MLSLSSLRSSLGRKGWLVIILSLLALMLAHGMALIYRIQPAVSLWFPPSGIAIALTLWFGPIGIILTGIASVLMAPFWGLTGWARLVGLTDILEPLIAWLLYLKFAKGELSFRRLRDAATFILSAPLAACATSAVIGSLTLVAIDKMPMSKLSTSIPNWWLGNALGTIAIAPTILLVLTPRIQHYFQRSKSAITDSIAEISPFTCPSYRRAEIVIILILSIFIASFTVSLANQGGFGFQQFSLLSFVPIIWAATRFGVTGGMLTTTFCVLVTLLAYLILNPYAISLAEFPVSPEVLHIHKLTLLIQCATSLLIGSASTERATTQVALAVEQVRAVEYKRQAQLSEQLIKLNEDLLLANTQLEASHDQLYQREQEFKALVENSPDIIARFDRQLRHVYVNSAIEQITGISAQDYIGKTHLELDLPEAKCHLWQSCIQEVFESKEEQVIEFDILTNQGTLYYQSRLVPEFAPDGTIVSVLAVTRNITKLKRTEAALRQSEYRLRRLVDSNLIGVLFANFRGEIIDANQAFLELVGYSLEDLRSGKMSWAKMTPPEYQILDREAIAQVKATGTCKPFEKEYLHQNGSRIPILLGVAKLESTEDECVCFVLNLTERKRVEAERERLLVQQQCQKELLEVILQQLPAGVILAEAPSGKVVFGNQRTEEMFGHSFFYSENVEEYSEWKLLYADGSLYPAREMPLARSLITGEVITGEEITLERGDGSKGIISVNSAPIKDRNGEIIAGVTAFYDITDRKQAEQEREQLLEAEKLARNVAETANRIKDEFLAVLSHELRSPLNPILGWVRLLRTRQFNQDTIDKALETIERNTRLQTQLIDDLLDVSRILRGKLSLNITKVNLPATIAAAIDNVKLSAEAKSIELNLTILDSLLGDNEPILVKGDPNRLQQVFWNLLSNAIKFTPEKGKVEISLSLLNEIRQPSSPKTYAQIQITDTGIGISPDFLPYVFEHFRQADASITRRHGGLGVGLSIVRKLVEMHGGTIQATSAGKNMGATFIVKLPLLESPSVTLPEAAE
ncbi:PAS domain S-box protein [Aerosakkonemataceae cyanobacterium BLCC-F154]|uniref:histidine kinase n=1 Tax=Floridaenema fluviatile BLCC-F154 TaxID=3153640 RepID=A0ABV4Y8A3_9CYAN